MDHDVYVFILHWVFVLFLFRLLRWKTVFFWVTLSLQVLRWNMIFCSLLRWNVMMVLVGDYMIWYLIVWTITRVRVFLKHHCIVLVQPYRDLDSHFSSLCVRIKVCLHLMSPSPCPWRSPSKFDIVSMVMDTLMFKMGCTSTLSVKVAIKKDQRCSSEIRWLWQYVWTKPKMCMAIKWMCVLYVQVLVRL